MLIQDGNQLFTNSLGKPCGGGNNHKTVFFFGFFFFFLFTYLTVFIDDASFVCVEVLRPSQPNGVMSSAVSLLNHKFTGQA